MIKETIERPDAQVLQAFVALASGCIIPEYHLDPRWKLVKLMDLRDMLPKQVAMPLPASMREEQGPAEVLFKVDKLEVTAAIPWARQKEYKVTPDSIFTWMLSRYITRIASDRFVCLMTWQEMVGHEMHTGVHVAKAIAPMSGAPFFLNCHTNPQDETVKARIWTYGLALPILEAALHPGLKN